MTLQKVVDACQFLLKTSPEAQSAREYLDSRINKDAQTRYEFGYFPSDEYLEQLIDLVGKDILEEYLYIYLNVHNTRDYYDTSPR